MCYWWDQGAVGESSFARCSKPCSLLQLLHTSLHVVLILWCKRVPHFLIHLWPVAAAITVIHLLGRSRAVHVGKGEPRKKQLRTFLFPPSDSSVLVGVGNFSSWSPKVHCAAFFLFVFFFFFFYCRGCELGRDDPAQPGCRSCSTFPR